MWCDKCKYSQPNPPEEIKVKIIEELTTEEYSPTVIIISKNDIERWKKEGKNPDVEIEKLKIERKNMIKTWFNELKSIYPKVVWCNKKNTFICCNPKRATTYVDMSKVCKHFEPKT